MAMEMFWDTDPVQLDTGRDQRIADGLEVAALSDGEDAYEPNDADQDIDYYNPQTKEFTASKNKKRKLRVAGGVAPTAKPVTANYDSDDGRIIELKQLGYSDEYVSNKLIEEGRIRYVGKTIGSRYLRLRKVLEDKEDEVLDDELSDWHEGEDEKLLSIVSATEKRLERQIEGLKLKMWKDVASYFAGQIGGKKKYTHKACRERCEAIAAGNELPPIELDTDQPGRRKMREERIKAAKAARIATTNEAIELESRKKNKAAERKREIAEANQKKVQFQLKRIAEKKERLRIRDERISNRQLAKDTRLRILNHMRIERDWEMEKTRREKEIYKKIMGIDLNGKPPTRSGRKNKNGYDSDEESEAIDDLESDEEEANFSELDEAEDADNESENELVDPELDDAIIVDSVVGSPVPPPSTVKLRVSTRPQRKRNTTENNPLLRSSERLSSPAGKKTASSKKKTPPKPATAADAEGNAVVTEQTLFSPRSVMSRNELDLTCFTRNIPRRPASEETHPELVARMNAIDEKLGRAELDDLLRTATEGVTGTRLAKIERLQKAEASQSMAGGMGLDSHDLDHMRRYEGFTGEFKYLLDAAENKAARHQPAESGSAGDVPAFADW